MSWDNSQFTVKDSLHTAVSGSFDVSGYAVTKFNTGPSRTQSGQKYYKYEDNMGVWLVSCAIGFADMSFDNIIHYYIIKHGRSAEVDNVSYYKNGTVASSYNYTYTRDTVNYLITKKTITDHNGKISTVTYVYE